LVQAHLVEGIVELLLKYCTFDIFLVLPSQRLLVQVSGERGAYRRPASADYNSPELARKFLLMLRDMGKQVIVPLFKPPSNLLGCSSLWGCSSPLI
jgi:hypothetical protein